MEDFDGYTIIKHLSSNSLFELYEAIDVSTSRTVLVKSISLSFLSENEDLALILIKEHEKSKHFSKRNITAKSRLKENGSHEFLVYELESYDFLKNIVIDKIVDYNFIYTLAIEIAQHLEAIHAKGFGHYNISPENIFFDIATNKVKLINICVYPRFDLICNLLYIAPEQTGRLAVVTDYRADFYSFGIILYQMVTGFHPINDTDPKAIYRRQITDRFPAPDSLDITIPSALSKIIHKLTSKQASNRYQNATSLKYDLINGQKLLKISPHNSFTLGTLDYISNLVFPEVKSFFEKEKEEIIALIKHFEQDKITIINLSGTLSQGKDDFAKDILHSLDKGKIFNITISALPSTGSVPFYSVSNILIETINNLFNSELFSTEDIVDFFKQLPNQHAVSLCKLCPRISTLFNITILQKDETITDSSVLNAAMRQLISFICKRMRPFVIYIENIENMDNSSMRLFIELMSDKELKNLIVIHSTINTVSLSRSIHNKNIIFKQYEIPRLTKRKISNLIQKLFNPTQEQSLQLIDIFDEKTNGKIKQIYAFITLLIEKKYIYFDTETFQWNFCFDKIATINTALSYETFIIQNFDKLDEITKNLLIECSLNGFIFDLRVLQHTLGYNIRSLSVLFREIQHLGFVESVDRFSKLNNTNNPLVYKFNNTKVHAIILEKNNTEHKQHIINTFSSIIEISKTDETVFFFFEEFIKKNQTLLSELSIDERVSMLNYYYQKAETYYYLKKWKEAEIVINYCVSLVNNEGWSSKKQNKTKSIYLLAMKCSIQTFYFSKADHYFELAKKNILEKAEIIPFYKVQIESLITRGKNSESLVLFKELLALSKFYPKKANSLYWKVASNVTQILFTNKIVKNKFLSSKNSKSTRRQVLHFINHRIENLDNYVYNYTLYKICKDSLINGIDKQYVFPLLRYSRNLMQNPKTFEKGIKLSTNLIELITKNEQEYELELHYYFKHILPFSNVVSTYNQSEIIKKHFINGEVNNAIDLSLVGFSLDFFKGINLNQLVGSIQKTIELVGESTRKNELLTILNIIEYRTKLLTQIRKKVDNEYEMSISSAKSSSSILTARWNNITLLLYFFLIKDYEKASICAQNVLQSSENTEDTISQCIVLFYDSLITSETLKNKTTNEKKIAIETLKQRVLFFKTLAKYNPDNFLHNSLILDAELAQITGNNKKAIQLFYEAIDCCDKQNLHHMCGYSHQRIAALYEKDNLKEKAINHYIKSYNYYKFWGTETIANKIKFEQFSIFDDLEIRMYNIS